MDPASGAFREARLLGQHAAAQFPEARARIGLDDGLADNVATLAALDRLVRSAAPPPDAPVPAILDAGCGPGRLAMDLADAAPAGTVAFDLRVAPLRLAAATGSGRDVQVGFLAEGRRFLPLPIPGRRPGGPVRIVQGDVLAPPFPAESFAAVIAVSLLDTVRDPIVALGQLDALLAPGGVLLLASPWAWDPAVTPPAWWLGDAATPSGDALCRALAGQDPVLPHLGCEVLHRVDLPWALPGNARLVHRYRMDVVLARKRGPRRDAP
jgi:SAM-dependent methyltransferase